MRGVSAKRMLLLAAAAASLAWGQPPTITSLQSSAVGAVPADVTGITSGTVLQAGGFYLYVNLASDFFPPLFQNVTWLDTSTNTTTILALPLNGVPTATQVKVIVPNALFQTAVANPVAVKIVVHGSGQTSNAATFTINPPLRAIAPVLPSGTIYQPYSASYTTGGTPPFLEAGVVGGTPPPGLTAQFPSTTMAGTPTQTGVFNFQVTALDFWHNSVSADDCIEIVDVPTLTSLSPNSAIAGAATLTMTVNGTNFVGPVTVGQKQIPGSQVQWTAGYVVTPLATTFVSSYQLAAVVPSALLAAVGSAAVTVAQPGNATSNALPFTVTAVAPVISGITPPSVPAGSNALTLTVTGANFVGYPAQYGQSIVSLNGAALTTTYVGSGVLTAAVPANLLTSPAQYSVQVTNPGGAVSNVVTFTVAAALSLGSISPTTAPVGSAAFTLAVTGASFVASSQVTLNSTALATTFVSSNSLTATVPASLVSSAGQFNVQVVSPGAAASNALPFSVVSPAIGSLSPSSVSSGVAAFNLAVSGVNFVSGSQVSLDGSALATSFASSTLLNAAVPAALVAGPKVASIVVTNPGVSGNVSLGAPFTVIATLAIATTSLPGGTSGSTYSVTLAGRGGTPPYTWTASGNPPGLAINPATGVLSGIPQTAGSYLVTVVLTDAARATATAQFPLAVTSPPPPPVSIAPSSNLPSGIVGVAYAGYVFANGGTSPYTFSLGSGNLPDGLALASTGIVWGTPNTPGQFSFSLVATDSAGATASGGFGITIQPAPLNITGGPTTSVSTGAPIAITFTATGGVGPYRCTPSGTLPPGTTFANCVLSGTPTTAGAFTFHVTIVDSTGATFTKDVTITVVLAPPLSLSGSLSNGKAGVPYTGQISASGGTGPYSYAGTGLPDGLSLSANGGISGTPGTAGQFTLAATATDSKGATANGTFGITIAPADLAIVTASLPDGVVGAAYSASLTASCGLPPYSWTVTGLPDGLTATASGAISGTPKTAGKFTVNVNVSDAAGTSFGDRRIGYSLTIAPAPLAITTASAPNGTAGTAYSASFAASGGTAPLTFSATGLPAGLSMSAAGAITGTPTAPGAATIVVTVKDAAGASASRSFPVTIGLPSAPPLNFTVAGVSD